MLDGEPVGNIWEQPLEAIFNSDAMRRHAPGARPGARGGDRHVLALLHDHSASAAGGGQPAGPREDGCGGLLPLVERLTYCSKLPRLLKPPVKDPRRSDLVQIGPKK